MATVNDTFNNSCHILQGNKINLFEMFRFYLDLCYFFVHWYYILRCDNQLSGGFGELEAD